MAAVDPWRPGALPLKVAQWSLLVRLFLLLGIALMWIAQGYGPAVLLVSGVAAVAYAVMRYPAMHAFLHRHPLIVLVDAVLVAALVGIVGVDTPFVLALCTSALLVGLWLPVLAGSLVIATLTAIHLALLTHRPQSSDGVTAYAVILPALFVTLWCLGLAIARSARAESASQAALRDAMSAAATAQERGRIAREMHDTIAKSLQAMALTAASLQVTIERRPAVAVTRAEEMERDCSDVIAQIRTLMSELRTPMPATPFADAVAQAVEEWRSKTGRRCVTRLAPVEVTDGLVRYELLMALREALDNVHQHAGRCTTSVTLTCPADSLVLRVADDGAGADLAYVSASPGRGHFGVAGMRERLERVGGRFVHETARGKGTTVTFTVNRRGLVEKQEVA